MTAIIVECLRCKHRGTVRDDDLTSRGEAPDAPIAKVIKRLRCSECGSASVRAYREAQVPRAPSKTADRNAP